MGYDAVIWDWNGTLLDDVDFSLKLLNRLLTGHGYAPLSGGLAAYRQVFRFPISEYYKDVGFDFSRTPYEALAEEYMALYEPGSLACPLQPGARQALAALKDAGVVQVVLSATQQEMLHRQLAHYGLAEGTFAQVLGLSNILGVSKARRGREWMAGSGIDPSRALMVGDTDHDWQTARAMGADCVLYARGHQARQVLMATGAPVIDDLALLAGLVLG